MEGDKNRLILLTVWPGFLPTPSHGGRQDSLACLGAIEISTHALTWRATISWGALIGQQSNFYPRPHMEGDGALWDAAVGVAISTHALTWRAT